ncbi:MAG: hypothetical protein KDC39_02750 [Actinobacteria bacterium]|nr:hypothetical protein [Actinomycetota bacterium]
MRRQSPRSPWFRTAVAGLLSSAFLLAGCTASGGESTTLGPTGAEASPSTTPEPPELPRGGRKVFPTYRLVGYSGGPEDSSLTLGRLTGDLDARCDEITSIGRKYKYGRKLMPVYELIATVVTSSPGDEGNYNFRRKDKQVREYLRAARKCKAILLLNIQPGYSEFIDEMEHFRKFIKEPDVGVALDAEWAMDPGESPGVHLGRSTGKELNEAADWLADIVDEYDLPQKVMVFHQFNEAVENVEDLKPHEGVALVRSIDGLGSPSAKVDTWKRLTKGQPKYFHPGFKLFYTEDTGPPHAPAGTPLMTPAEVMALKPQPEYILYE